VPSCAQIEEDGQDVGRNRYDDLIKRRSSSSAQTALQAQHNQQQHSEQHDKTHSCLELVGLPPFELLGWRHDEGSDAVEDSTKHSRSTGRDDVTCIHTTSGCTLEQTEYWSDSEDILPESSKGTLQKSQ
jgi:hypothetical protein